MEIKKFKHIYEIYWCDLCNCASIVCPVCKNGSCNGGGCEKCFEAFDEWHKQKIYLENYLSTKEFKIYEKALLIRQLMLDTLDQYSEINFLKLAQDGHLSRLDEDLLNNFLK